MLQLVLDTFRAKHVKIKEDKCKHLDVISGISIPFKNKRLSYVNHVLEDF